jgi:acetyl-CoA C-acetyltransferase
MLGQQGYTNTASREGHQEKENTTQAVKGAGTELLREGECSRDGRLPVNTFGGLKARGHPVGASGVYQIAELALQLSNEAGRCQVSDPKVGLAQSVGGIGGTVAVHILQRTD